MKTATRTVAIVTTLLAGTVAAIAHPQDQRQRQGRVQQQKQGCPVCGNPNFRPKGHGPHQRRPSACGPQFRQPRPGRPQAFQKWKPTPEQRKRIKQRHQKMLELFDLDGDGRISKQERQAVREVWEEHLRQKATEVAAQPESAPAKE